MELLEDEEQRLLQDSLARRLADRYGFEQMIVRSGIQLFKYYLDISREEQGRRLEMRAYGERCREPQPEPCTADTIYDVASLTKVTSVTESPAPRTCRWSAGRRFSAFLPLTPKTA